MYFVTDSSQKKHDQWSSSTDCRPEGGAPRNRTWTTMRRSLGREMKPVYRACCLSHTLFQSQVLRLRVKQGGIIAVAGRCGLA